PPDGGRAAQGKSEADSGQRAPLQCAAVGGLCKAKTAGGLAAYYLPPPPGRSEFHQSEKDFPHRPEGPWRFYQSEPAVEPTLQTGAKKVKEILDDIKNGTFHRAYLLYGPEAYLKQQYRNKLLDALVPEGDTMNFARFEGKGLDEGQIIDLAETVPFFADHRVILLENTGLFKAKADRLADYTAALPDYLVLIFVEEGADKRSRLYKGVQKAGLVTEFGVQKEDDLMRWVLGILKREKKKITRPDMELFLEKTGSDMGNIHMELQKLLDYTLGREVIAREDIEAVCTTQISNRIFDMIRAMTEKRQKEALK